MNILRKILSGIFVSSCVFLFFLSIHTADAATLYFSGGGSYSVGQTFSVSVLVSTDGEAMNAASGNVLFPADKLQLLSISKSASIITFWTQEPSFSNAAGSASFEGIAYNPGYTGQSGRIVTLTFKAKATGSATISYTGASVLANDGSGTELLSGTRTATFDIADAVNTPAPTPAPVTTPSKPTVTTTKPTTNTVQQIIVNSSTTRANIDHYTIQTDKGDIFPISLSALQNNTFTMPVLDPGVHTILVTAYDTAGNASPAPLQTFTVTGLDLSKIYMLVIALAVLFILWILYLLYRLSDIHGRVVKRVEHADLMMRRRFDKIKAAPTKKSLDEVEAAIEEEIEDIKNF